MNLSVRPMPLEETGMIIDYFYNATPEFLENMGVDPTRLPERGNWRERYERDYAQPIERRRSFMVLWELERRAIGFSSVDKIKFGNEAFMHLHVTDAALREAGHGAECVRRTVAIYFETFKLQRLFCEPNAFNVAPNRTMQKAGFRYVKTHMTVPGVLNYHQAVTRWVMERSGE